MREVREMSAEKNFKELEDKVEHLTRRLQEINMIAVNLASAPGASEGYSWIARLSMT